MHEVGIASEILRASHAEAARRPGARLVAVTVRIGVLAGVDADALRFAWDVMSEQAEYEPVTLADSDDAAAQSLPGMWM